ncbi:hypothetical protein JL09_g6626 [Pichia kudriavzevii]|uniref:Uncharacterized protein n=1 Tax=Pichia kudriavzevii TaxID=4909 RepID=A0A099NM39_PICKU|nr:hypothetical protein JL09_g6626 [Pichia kudriavzevii]
MHKTGFEPAHSYEIKGP